MIESRLVLLGDGEEGCRLTGKAHAELGGW